MPDNSNVDFSTDLDVLIVGAGAAGLSAFRELDRAGCRVICVEARDRVGGRILTHRDPLSPIPIELGAEFVHGRPPEIWDIIRSAGLAAYDCAENAIHIRHGELRHDDPWKLVGGVMDDMRGYAAENNDRSFLSFLNQSAHPENAKTLALSYVQGFNAARSDLIGIASLTEDARAAEQIGGDRSFRIFNGYESVVCHLLRGIDDAPTKLILSCIVESIAWKSGSAEVLTRSALTGRAETLRSRCVLITVPLGVLQAGPDVPGAIRFSPEPATLLAAARALHFGQVIRIVLRFREPFWEDNPELSDAGFLLSDQQFFPTWWTPRPVHAPLITGWSAGPHADDLLNLPQPGLIDCAIAELATITKCRRERLNSLLEAAYFHDWHADPFARGGYSYVPAGALDARKALAQPVEKTLYFAGEATEVAGHSATVHGAIASGRRAAKQILTLSGISEPRA